MGIAVYLNQTEKITVTFYGFPDPDTGESSAEDPTDLEIRIYDTSTVPDTLLTTDSAIPLGPVGKFYYEWTPDTLGDFNVQFFATFTDGSTNPVNNFFTAFESTTPPSGTGGLLTDQVYEVAGVLDPLYIDPEDVKLIYPDADMVQIAELVNEYSSEVKSILKLQDDEDPPFVALDYIQAATLCSLTRLFGDVAGSNFSFQLGDLQITNRPPTNQTINRGTATTWCELAFTLRTDLLALSVNFKKLYKGRGGGDCRLFPSRRLRAYPDSGGSNTNSIYGRDYYERQH